MDDYISRASNCQDVITDKDEMREFMDNFVKDLQRLTDEQNINKRPKTLKELKRSIEL